MRASGALTAARTAGMLIVQVQVGFRLGLPEVNGHNKLFAAVVALQLNPGIATVYFQSLSEI